MDMVGRGGGLQGAESVGCMERVTRKLTICKIDSQWEFAVWLRKLKQGLCINLEGWEGVSKGRDICIPMAVSC